MLIHAVENGLQEVSIRFEVYRELEFATHLCETAKESVTDKATDTYRALISTDIPRSQKNSAAGPDSSGDCRKDEQSADLGAETEAVMF